jgi:hypothetical protein
MKAEDVQEVEINVRCLAIHETGQTLNKGRTVNRDEEPELLALLLKSMSNVGEGEGDYIRVVKRVKPKKAKTKKTSKKSKSKKKKGDSKKKSKKSKESKKSEKDEDDKDDKDDE